MHVRGWVARVLEHEAFGATQALAKTTFKDTDVEVKVRRHTLYYSGKAIERDVMQGRETSARGACVSSLSFLLSWLDVCAR
jgi:hypothetical protein